MGSIINFVQASLHIRHEKLVVAAHFAVYTGYTEIPEEREAILYEDEIPLIARIRKPKLRLVPL